MSRPTPPPPAGLRRAVERRSAPALVFLSQKPKLLIPVLTALLLIGGLALPRGPGVACLVLLAALVGWLSYLSWPAVVGPARLIRIATLGLIAFALAQRLLF